ncbi:MAG: hypothetical protein E6R08_09015 [Nevskiaceae bacterium]|nr:MAG: hypothetical protein E6R08_09015 [Nevskiaceae bacterium]
MIRHWTGQKILFAIGAEMLVLLGIFTAAVPGGLSSYVNGWLNFLAYGATIIGVRIAAAEYAFELASTRLKKKPSRRLWVPVLCGVFSWMSWAVCMITINGNGLGSAIGTLPFGLLSAGVAAQCVWSTNKGE